MYCDAVPGDRLAAGRGRHAVARHVAPAPAMLAAILSLVACRDEAPATVPAPRTTNATTSSPSAGRCGARPEISIDTVCGAAITCDKGTLPIALAVERGAFPSLRRRCLSTLQNVVDRLAKAHAPAEPQYGLRGPMDATETCVRPGIGAQAKATTAILARVRQEGRARVEAAHLDDDLARFDFTEMRASCVARGFLLELFSDRGAPGAIAYHGIWRVTAGETAALYELHDTQVRSRVWPAGDLDGDGMAELLLRTPTGELEGEDPIVFHARYDVISIALPKPIEVAERVRVEQPMDGDETVVPPVWSVALPSGGAVVVDGQPHRLEGTSMVAMPALSSDLDAVLAAPDRLREQLLSPPPKKWNDGPPCENPDRVGWARRTAPILGRTLDAAEAVVPLAGLWACPDAWQSKDQTTGAAP